MSRLGLISLCILLCHVVGCFSGKSGSHPNEVGQSEIDSRPDTGSSGAQTVDAVPPELLSTRAREILKERCYMCHGESGANEGGFNYVLNRAHLVRSLVSPGSPLDSRLFNRITRGEMPPDGDPVPPDEAEVIRQWIAAGAPAFASDAPSEFISQIEMLTFIAKDLDAADKRTRLFYRYFTLTHLRNAGFSDDELESYRAGLSKLVNSLSWGRNIRAPQAIDPEKTVLRIDLRDYRWNENAAWGRIVASDPYAIGYFGEVAMSCYDLSGCESPFVRADWFVSAASRPPLYHEVLNIPERVEILEMRVGVNAARNLTDFNGVKRAAFYPSGVSKSNRLIERHSSIFGAYWKSYDFKPVSAQDQTPRRRDLKAYPLGPTSCGRVSDHLKFFQHDGGEIIFHLPNGLQAYMLIDALGNRIDRGPTDVVVDKESVKRGRDPDVVNGVSCMSCHWSGMLDKADQVRDHVLARKQAFTSEELDAISALYPPKAEFEAILSEDRARFEEAVKKCGAPLSRTEPVSALAYRFNEPIELSSAAAEAGVTSDQLMEVFDRDPSLARSLGQLALGQSVQRDNFEEQFPRLVESLRIGTSRSPRLVSPHLAGARQLFARGEFQASVDAYSRLISEEPSTATHYAERAFSRLFSYEERYWSGELGGGLIAGDESIARRKRYLDSELAPIQSDMRRANELEPSLPAVVAYLSLINEIEPLGLAPDRSRLTSNSAIERLALSMTRLRVVRGYFAKPVESIDVYLDPMFTPHDLSPAVRQRLRAKYKGLLSDENKNAGRLNKTATAEMESVVRDIWKELSAVAGRQLSEDEAQAKVMLFVLQRAKSTKETELPEILNPRFRGDEEWLRGAWYMCHMGIFVGDGLFNLGADLELSADLASRAIDASPRSVLGYLARGHSRSHRKQYQEALTDLDDAVRLRPSGSFPLELRSSVLAELGNDAAARRDSAHSLDLTKKANERWEK